MALGGESPDRALTRSRIIRLIIILPASGSG